jgi:hypothetical protein
MKTWWERNQPDWELVGFFAVVMLLIVLMVMVLGIGAQYPW